MMRLKWERVVALSADCIVREIDFTWSSSKAPWTWESLWACFLFFPLCLSARESWSAPFLTRAGPTLLKQPGSPLLPGGHHVDAKLSATPYPPSTPRPIPPGLHLSSWPTSLWSNRHLQGCSFFFSKAAVDFQVCWLLRWDTLLW